MSCTSLCLLHHVKGMLSMLCRVPSYTWTPITLISHFALVAKLNRLASSLWHIVRNFFRVMASSIRKKNQIPQIMFVIISNLSSLHQLRTIMWIFGNCNHHLHLQLVMAYHFKNSSHGLIQKQCINKLGYKLC